METIGIIHAHSRYSYDAKLSLRELRELCIENGLHFVCMTEHTDELDVLRAQAFVRECEELSDETFIFIPGFEVPYKRAHILMIGQRNFFSTYAPTLEDLNTWSKGSSFVVLAHPVRNNFEVEDGLLEQIDALEVWNQQYEGKRVPRTRSLTLLQTLRIKKPALLAVGGVDLHRKEHMGTPQITLAVDALNEHNILEKLKMGAFTISSPQAHLFGTLPNVDEIIQKHRRESFVSVCIIVLGKFVNKILAGIGISLPRSWKHFIRKKL